MKKIIMLALVASLGGCAATPEEMAQLSASLNQLGQVGTNMQMSAAQAQQANAQIFQAVAPANREWTQRNDQGVIVHCVQAGNVITCK